MVIKVYYEMWYEYVSRVCGRETAMNDIHCVGRSSPTHGSLETNHSLVGNGGTGRVVH